MPKISERGGTETPEVVIAISVFNPLASKIIQHVKLKAALHMINTVDQVNFKCRSTSIFMLVLNVLSRLVTLRREATDGKHTPGRLDIYNIQSLCWAAAA